MNYYKILGVNKNSSQKEIRESYKKLVKKYHPDLYRGDKSFAEKKTKEINVAYDILSSPEKRAEYDDEISPKYAYTQNNYNQNINYNKSASKYNDYRQKYANNYYNTQNNHDGSEHDYSTYANYENINKTYNYKYYRYGNSNYTNRKNYQNDFYEKIINKFDKFPSNTKKKIVALLFIIYFVFIFFSLKDLRTFLTPKSELLNDDNSSYQSEDLKIQQQNDNKIKNENITSINENSSSRENQTSSNSLTENTPIVKIPSNNQNTITNNENPSSDTSENSLDNKSFTIYDIYSEDELKALYEKYYEGTDTFYNFDEFKDFLDYYLNQYIIGN